RGFSRFSDILSQSHLSGSPLLADVLKKLMLMDMVYKEAPINDANNKRKTGYYMSDPMSMFYYRYVFRYASQRRIMNPEAFFQRYIETDFEQFYVPKRFEDICKQFLILKNQRDEMDEPFEAIGKYYYDLPQEHKNGEFDVVTKDDRGYAFYEVKFRADPVSNAMIEKEIQQVNRCGLYCHRYGFFSRSGFEDASRSDVVKYTLDDLYREA
ncbi:MAG: ATP-binding protein, partial [Selenomonadaceae bacterium]|nr:ATP-binding protein [Selenomonadaceae bacterium]